MDLWCNLISGFAPQGLHNCVFGLVHSRPEHDGASQTIPIMIIEEQSEKETELRIYSELDILLYFTSTIVSIHLAYIYRASGYILKELLILPLLLIIEKA